MEKENTLSVALTNNYLLKAQTRIKKEILDYLIKNPNETDKTMSAKIKVGRSTFTTWKNGNFNIIPKTSNIIKLGNVIKVSPAYLMGLSDYRSEDSSLKDLISQNAIVGLKNLQDSLDEYREKLNEFFIFDDINYVDVISSVIGNERFWRTLMHEAQRLISLQVCEPTQNTFESIINKDDMIDNPTRIDYIDIIHQVNAKAINTVFDEYIKNKKNELNIQEKEFEERVSSPILKIKEDN